MASFSKTFSSSKNKENTDDDDAPTVSPIIHIRLTTTKDFEEKYPIVNPRTWVVCVYPSSIRPSSIPAVKEDCGCQDLNSIASDLAERVTFSKKGYTYVYTYPFTLGPFSLSGSLISLSWSFASVTKSA